MRAAAARSSDKGFFFIMFFWASWLSHAAPRSSLRCCLRPRALHDRPVPTAAAGRSRAWGGRSSDGGGGGVGEEVEPELGPGVPAKCRHDMRLWIFLFLRRLPKVLFQYI